MCLPACMCVCVALAAIIVIAIISFYYCKFLVSFPNIFFFVLFLITAASSYFPSTFSTSSYSSVSAFTLHLLSCLYVNVSSSLSQIRGSLREFYLLALFLGCICFDWFLLLFCYLVGLSSVSSNFVIVIACASSISLVVCLVLK